MQDGNLVESGKADEVFDNPKKEYTNNDYLNKKGILVMFICNHCPYVLAVLDRILRDCIGAHAFGKACLIMTLVLDIPFNLAISI